MVTLGRRNDPPDQGRSSAGSADPDGVRGSSSDHLRLRDEVEPDGVTVYVAGDVDMATCGALGDHLHLAIQKATSVAVDLGDVGFIDSSGLGILVTCYHEAREAGGDLSVAHLQAAARKVFSITGLDQIITVRT